MGSTEDCRSDCWAQFAKHFHKHLHLILPSLLWCEAEAGVGGERRGTLRSSAGPGQRNFVAGHHTWSLGGLLCSHRNTPLVPSVQLLSRVQLFVTPMDCSTPGFPVHHQLPELTETHVHQVSDAIQPSHPVVPVPVSSCLQSFPASGSFPVSQFFASDGQSIGVSFSISPSNEYSRLILG